MLQYPNINPIALSIGPLKVHWYGIMYLIGFGSAWWLGLYRSRRADSPIRPEQVGDAIFYGALGVIIGGRLGYMLFYNLTTLWHHPLSLFTIWDGGMSFHGGLIGVGVAFAIYCYRNQINVFDIWDFFTPMVPIGLGAGRLGNFINGELWGRVTDSRIGMIFPNAGPLPRYPSQLIEFFLEGVVLFIILWTISRKPRPRLFVIASFLLFYGIFRFIAEFFRQPDPQMGYILFNWMTMGQILCIPMVIAGSAILLTQRFTDPPNQGVNSCNNT